MDDRIVLDFLIDETENIPWVVESRQVDLLHRFFEWYRKNTVPTGTKESKMYSREEAKPIKQAWLDYHAEKDEWFAEHNSMAGFRYKNFYHYISAHTEPEPKPCPFCGSDAKRRTGGITIRCSNLNCEASTGFWKHEAWNTRAG